MEPQNFQASMAPPKSIGAVSTEAQRNVAPNNVPAANNTSGSLQAPANPFTSTLASDSKHNLSELPSDPNNSIGGGLEDTTTPNYLRSWQLASVILSLCLGTFLVALDNTIIGVAIPTITSDFHSLQDIGWYGGAYLITLTAFQPTFGLLFREFHTKWMYMASVVIFEGTLPNWVFQCLATLWLAYHSLHACILTVSLLFPSIPSIVYRCSSHVLTVAPLAGSLLCALAPTSPAFITGRAIAGVGAAGLFQGGLAIISLIVELEKRPFYIGIVTSVFGLSVCVGPVLGGALTDGLSWRWNFWINLPIGGAVLVTVLFILRLNRTSQERRGSILQRLRKLDPLGTIVLLGAVVSLLLALQWGGQTLPWSDSRVIGLFVGCGLLTLLFSWLQWRSADNSLIPLRVLRQRSVLMGSLFSFFVKMPIFVVSSIVMACDKLRFME